MTYELLTANVGEDFSVKVSRAKFEGLCDDLFKGCLEVSLPGRNLVIVLCAGTATEIDLR